MAKCKDCKHYKKNPDFDYYKSHYQDYARCDKEQDDIFWSSFEGVYQEAQGYEIDCADYEASEE